MTNVGPDLLLPGVASKKPVAASAGESKDAHDSPVDGADFAQELDTVVSSERPNNASGQEITAEGDATVGTPNDKTATEIAAAPTAQISAAPTEQLQQIKGAVETSVDTAELHLFNPAPQTNAATVASTVTLDSDAVLAPVEGLAPLAMPQDVPATPLLVSGEQTDVSNNVPILPVTPTVASTAGEAEDQGPNVVGTVILHDGNDAAADVLESALAPRVVLPSPEIQPIRQNDAGTTPDENGLLSAVTALNGVSGARSITPAKGQPAGVTPLPAPQAPQTQGPNPALVAASLAVDPLGLSATDADGGQNTNLQNDKAAARTAATLAPDAKPTEATGGQSFSNALSTAASEAASQSARGAAQAAAQRPARPAQTAPPTAQIAVHIVRAVGDGISRFNVQLHPAELGRVEVKMEVSTDGAVRAVVTAERQETVDQLQRDSRALERALQEAGLKADSQNLHFSLRGGQNGRGLSENRTSIGNSGDADLTEVPEPALAAHWSNVAGSTGALDIRV